MATRVNVIAIDKSEQTFARENTMAVQKCEAIPVDLSAGEGARLY
ncbi:hypothetical protein [Adhaeretor mobilis]|nr:hypothetical protein [Adhaeretor mobilis]